MNILQLDLQSEYCEEFIFLKNKAAFPVQALNCLFFLNDIFVIFFFFLPKKVEILEEIFFLLIFTSKINRI